MNCQNKKILLGLASVWDKRKGLDSFIELSEKLEDIYQIVLVGLSKSQIKKLPNRILGLERTNCVHELAELYTAADVFVNPTTNRKTYIAIRKKKNESAVFFLVHEKYQQNAE